MIRYIVMFSILFGFAYIAHENKTNINVCITSISLCNVESSSSL